MKDQVMTVQCPTCSRIAGHAGECVRINTWRDLVGVATDRK